VKRDATDRVAVKKALALLRDGHILGIFPEGTRSKDGTLGHPQAGVIALAEKGGAVIIPTAVIGTQKVSLKTPAPKIKVIFGKPLTFDEKTNDKQVLQERAEQLMQNIQTLLIIHEKS
jgi:1-acyl-sn-glycerol-3-phosphate acyltransferase